MACLPYKDSVMISAQVLSIVGFFLSLVSFALFPGLVTFIMLQVVWCCSMNKCGLITAGVFAIISSVISILDGVLLLVSTNGSSFTFISTSSSSYSSSSISTSSSSYSSSSTYSSCTQTINGVTYDCSGSSYSPNSGSVTVTTNEGPFIGVAVVSFIGAAVWIATAVCVFIFVRSGRYEKFMEARFGDNDVVVPSATIAPTPTTTSPKRVEESYPSPQTTEVEYVEDLENDIESRPSE